MELLAEIGSRSWINGSGKKDSRKFGLFQCPVCGTAVEKSISHGKRDKNCGSKECRKATFERNPNMRQSSKANGNPKKSKYRYGSDPLWRNFSKVFYEMHRRCYDENNAAYKNYGAVGITVAPEWHDIECFADDMFEAYKEQMKQYDGTQRTRASLDRTYATGIYSKDNCEWITLSENTSKDRKVPVIKMDMDGNLVATYQSMTEATMELIKYGSKSIRANTHGIGDCCRGKTSEHAGYKWAFATSKESAQKHNCLV